jgi:Aspartyl protease/PDZ domain
MKRVINRINVAGAIVLIGSALASASIHAGTDPEAERVLRHAAEAADEARWSSVRFIRVKGKLATSGLSGTFETLFDARTGGYRNSQQLGPVSGADGFDGTVVWQQDDAGQTALQGSEDSVRGAANTAYQNARGYWHRDRFPADIVYVRRQEEGADVFDVLRVTPTDGRPVEEWFDARSHLLARTVEQAATRTTTTYFSDYRRVLGALVAYTIRQTTGENKYDVFLKIESVSPEANHPATAFAPSASSKVDFGISSGDGTTTVPFKLINNHMYVEVKLNGKSYDFLFDTGGRNVVTPTTARALGLTTQGALQGSGVGEKSEDFGLTKVSHMAIGGAHLDDQTFVVIALESLGAVEGRPITGIFGYEVFKRFIVRTDYERQKITLSDPGSFKYSGSGTRVPFTFSDTQPVVNGEIDGLKGTFTLDTGSRASLDLSSPFVVRNDLVKRWSANFRGVSGWGAGGAARSSFVRPKMFLLGGIPIPGPVVGLSEQRKGAESDIYVAGNVGAGILKRFNIIWDYPHLQIFFERNMNYSEPDVFDRAGLWANLGGHGFTVIDVISGGPADHAGLKAGDDIVSVDGRVAGGEMSLPEFRQYVKGALGTSLTLNILRGKQSLQITVILRDLV